MNKKDMSERDICSKYITPALIQSGWDLQKQIREEVTFTDGRVIVRKKMVSRGDKKRADYILYYKTNIPIAIIEAKDNKHSLGSGMQQGLNYGEILDIPFVYSSNGDGFLEHDRTAQSGMVEQEISLSQFPSPEDLWNRYKQFKGIDQKAEETITQDYYFDQGSKSPRYYQRIAINRTIEASQKDKIVFYLSWQRGLVKHIPPFKSFIVFGSLK
ncbi:type I site-specific restriction endonuclease [Paenibacillus sp. W2I17]|nr:type I restriction endonuclease [Paenibacillus sp. W2I17]MDQ0658581.1 type I site-specific restriction endonuclease [Paenibacillus sp. W2I17]